MPRFVKIPIVITAVQWKGYNIEEVARFCGVESMSLIPDYPDQLVIDTLEDGSNGEAIHIASKMDWIIKGIAGEFYPCKPDIFAKLYCELPDDDS